MSIRLRKTVMSVLFGALLAGNLLPAQADTQDRLPDIGTTAGGTLSINQELAMGIFTSANCVPAHRLSTIRCCRITLINSVTG